MDGDTSILWLIPGLPLLGAVINAVSGFRLGRRASAVAILAMVGSFALTLLTLVKLVSLGAKDDALRQHLFTMANAGALRIDFALSVDALSMTLMLVITGIGTLIHVYSTAYMDGDEG